MVNFKSYNFPFNKNLYSFLISIFGIGKFRSKFICNILKMNYFKRCSSLTDTEKKLILDKISMFKVGFDLKNTIKNDIKKLISIKCYRGIRHFKKLPVRGQNTRNNSRTRKGIIKKVFLNKNLNFKKNVKKKKR